MAPNEGADQTWALKQQLGNATFKALYEADPAYPYPGIEATYTMDFSAEKYLSVQMRAVLEGGASAADLNDARATLSKELCPACINVLEIHDISAVGSSRFLGSIPEYAAKDPLGYNQMAFTMLMAVVDRMPLVYWGLEQGNAGTTEAKYNWQTSTPIQGGGQNVKLAELGLDTTSDANRRQDLFAGGWRLQSILPLGSALSYIGPSWCNPNEDSLSWEEDPFIARGEPNPKLEPEPQPTPKAQPCARDPRASACRPRACQPSQPTTSLPAQ